MDERRGFTDRLGERGRAVSPGDGGGVIVRVQREHRYLCVREGELTAGGKRLEQLESARAGLLRGAPASPRPRDLRQLAKRVAFP
jgi:hypothetical protein